MLSGIDPRVASEADAHVELSAIYTGLFTTEVEDEARGRPRGDELGLARQPRRLSALEQLNRRRRFVLLGDPGSGKSTFVNFVAQCLCGEALGHPVVNLKRLTEPLPVDSDAPARGDRTKPQPQQWDHPALTPVMVTLREFAARGLPSPGQAANAKHLTDFIRAQLAATPVAGFADQLEKTWYAGCLLLLDGLDEVPEAQKRRSQIKQVVEDFAATYGQARLLVTSRTYAYQRQDWQLKEFAVAELAAFTPAQINLFVERWYAHIGPLRKLTADKIEAQARELKQSIANSRRLSEFASRPLLLALMASLHAWRNGRLPEKRESLYNDSVDLLLETWERAKVVDGQSQSSLSELLEVTRDRVRGLLHELAYNAHARQPELEEGAADIPESELVAGLMRLTDNREVNPTRLMDYLSQRAGLLLPHGVGVYTFPHRTFQEYLAACFLTDKNYPSEIARLARSDPNRWREVALLAGAKAARGGLFGVWALANKLCPREPGAVADSAEEAYGAILAGQALSESIDVDTVVEADEQAALERVRRWLVRVLQNNLLPARERCLAGDVLARVGDPRFDPDLFFLPKEDNLGFVRIPAGKFLMGTRKADIPKLMEQFGGEEQNYTDEVEQHEVDMPEFYIARYPVTVAQFRAFTIAIGKEGDYVRALRGLLNHPVTNVTWHGAIAYCNWLTQALRASPAAPEPLKGLLHQGWRITLPGEAEWEKAARGATARVFAWGDDYDPDKANVSDTRLGDTSPVGCFARGATPEDLQDMTGNVWEWTRSHYKPYPYVFKDGREDLKAGDNILRVLRGGSFSSGARYARCACRDWVDPDGWYDDVGFRVVAVPFNSAL